MVIVNPSDKTQDIWLLQGWKDDEILIGNNHENGILKVEPKSVAILGRGDWAKKLKI